VSIVQVLAERLLATHAMEDAPFFLAICGWADTGKSTLAANLCHAIESHNVSADWISTDAFLKSREDRNKLGISGYHPLALDAKALSIAVARLVARREYVYFPYDNRTGRNVSIATTIAPESIVVIEGVHAFNDAIWRFCHLRMFIDADEGTLRAMRARANVRKRGMSGAEAMARIDNEFEEYRTYVLPRKRLANIFANVSLEFEYDVEDDLF
jgi:uridine kinase